jgi:hypothetical protein
MLRHCHRPPGSWRRHRLVLVSIRRDQRVAGSEALPENEADDEEAAAGEESDRVGCVPRQLAASSARTCEYPEAYYIEHDRSLTAGTRVYSWQ